MPGRELARRQSEVDEEPRLGGANSRLDAGHGAARFACFRGLQSSNQYFHEDNLPCRNRVTRRQFHQPRRGRRRRILRRSRPSHGTAPRGRTRS